VKRDRPHILCVNPWVHDFAAYDFWAQPAGLLTVAAILRRHGFDVTYLDCLDRFHPRMPATDPSQRYGRGPYLKTRIPKPLAFKAIDRNFCRYGIKKEWLRKDLDAVPLPDLIFVTAQMTYWYPGLQETIGVLKDRFPQVKIILGGIYATLCREHALQYSGADEIVSGPGERTALQAAAQYTGFAPRLCFDLANLDTYPYPAFDLQSKIGYIPLITTKGCPFSCAYCAANFLNPTMMRRSPEAVIDEILFWHAKFGVHDFVFYDDALLTNSHRHAVPLLEGIIRKGLDLRFHTPNALHIREITPTIAKLLAKANFQTLRLGLETAIFEDRYELDGKVTADQFENAAAALRTAGFDQKQVGAYLLVGLPGQSLSTVAASIEMVKACRITPICAYYTPIPHTALWDKAVAASPYDLRADPLFTNNAVFPCWEKGFSWKTLSTLKQFIAAESCH
jgi:radical SAM superfamily enzyme YgiQ (UPF0313 family)